MIEIVASGNGYSWTLISADFDGSNGRVLAYSTEVFPCIDSAATEAKAWRTEFWARADQIDHRMAWCI